MTACNLAGAVHAGLDRAWNELLLSSVEVFLMTFQLPLIPNPVLHSEAAATELVLGS
jgi:hypothetical protein